MIYAHGETVTRLRPVMSLDPYSEELKPDWSLPPAELEYPGCAVWDTGSTEPITASGDPVESDFSVAGFPPGADLTAQDRIRIRGLDCEIVGRSFDWKNPYTGWNPGLLVNAKVKEG